MSIENIHLAGKKVPKNAEEAKDTQRGGKIGVRY